MYRTAIRLACLAAGICWFWAAPASAGDIYVYQDSDGSRLITDHPRVEPGYRLIKIYSESDVWNQTGASRQRTVARPRPSAYDDLIDATARRVSLDPMLIKSVMHAESGFDPNAVSRKGASGLMQLMPDTARRYGVSSVFDPRQNVMGGARYLSYLLDRFNGNLEFALAGYNAGENVVEEVGGIPPYDETRRYVTKVMRLYREYRTKGCEQHIDDGTNFSGRIISCSASLRGPSIGNLRMDLPPSNPPSSGTVLSADSAGDGQWRHVE